MKRITRTSSAGGFTLVESIAVIVVLGTISGVMMPIIMRVSDSYASASETRRTTESLSFALDRLTRELREVPETFEGSGLPDLVRAESDAVEFADGTLIELNGSTLWLTVPGGEPSPLCQGIAAFDLTYCGTDGQELDFSSGDEPSQTRRIFIALISGSIELHTSVYLRIALTGDA